MTRCRPGAAAGRSRCAGAVERPPETQQLCAPMLTGRNLTVLGMTESRPSEGYIVGYRLTAAGWCETSRREATTLARASALDVAPQSPRAWEAGWAASTSAGRACGATRRRSGAGLPQRQ